MKIILLNKTFSTFIMGTFVFLASVNTQAEIYKWTDAKGVTHYSSQKPVHKKIKTEDIENKIRFAAGSSKATQYSNKNSSSQEKNNSQSGKKQQELSGPSEKLTRFCKNQRLNLSKLTNNYRNVWKEKDGKTTVLNQSQRKEKVKQIKKSIAVECSGV